MSSRRLLKVDTFKDYFQEIMWISTGLQQNIENWRDKICSIYIFINIHIYIESFAKNGKTFLRNYFCFIQENLDPSCPGVVKEQFLYGEKRKIIVLSSPIVQSKR